MAKKFPIHPRHPEKVCWGCSLYCLADDLRCGNGSERIQHPVETNGEDWYRKGDWHGLLTSAQQQELGIVPAPRENPATSTMPAGKPRIRLHPKKTNTAQ